MTTKYSKNGPISSVFFNQWDIDGELSNVLADAANMALAKNTWSNYTTVENHINRCSLKNNIDLSFPWDIEKTLKFIGFLKTDRNCAAKTIDCYLSAVRMAHLSRGIDSPHLRQPIIKMIIKGFAHSDALRSKLEKKLGRFPVTIPVLKYIKRKLNNINWPTEKKHRVWAVATLLWGGSLRCHEALSRECRKYDETNTLLFEDVKFCDAKVGGKWEKLLKIKLKCPKESSVGNGVVIEVFRNDTFLCATKALKKYLKNCPVKLEAGKPLFRTPNGGNYTGRQFNQDLAEITAEITAGTQGIIRSHSFRAGVASEMGLCGFSDEQIMAVGRWSSLAFKTYCKLPRSKRLNQQHKLVTKVLGKSYRNKN